MKAKTFLTLVLLNLMLYARGEISPLILPVQKGESGQCHTFQQIIQESGNSVRDALKLKPVPECGEGLWREVVSLNMTDKSQQCPSGWTLRSSPRSCTQSQQRTCALATFPSGTIFYKVCGRAVGIARGANDAFQMFTNSRVGFNYVDGVNVFLTGDTPHHVWTFATDLIGNGEPRCPCGGRSDFPIPDYVGSNYFCDTNSATNIRVWDGKGCIAATCCDYNSPPWFKVTFPVPFSSDFQVRICTDEISSNENISVEELQLFVQ